MGDFLLRKCVARGSGMPVPTGEGRVLDAVVSSAASSGCKTRRILHGAEEEEEEAYSSVSPAEQQGFRICHKRARSCCIIMHTPPHASCSSGNIVHVGSVVSSLSLCAASSVSSSSTTDEVGLPEPCEERTRAKEKESNNRLRLQGMAAVSSEGGKQGERLRISHQTVMTGVHSSLESSSSASSCVVPSFSSSCNNSQEEEPEPEAEAASKLGELESTAANTGPAPVSRPTTVAVAHPDLHEIEAFFAKAEEELRQAFANKYNYDIVKDTPLEGRYEWIRIKPPQ